MLEINTHPEADEEIKEAARYYEQRVELLGHDFLDEVEAGLERIRSFPRAWPVYEGEYRRCLLKRFPYGIVYRIGSDSLYVIAVTHLSRRPGYWKDRKFQ